MDLKGMKNDTAQKAAIRAQLNEVIMAALIAWRGEENVVYIPYAIEPNEGSKINGGSIAVCVGTVVNKDGFEVDAVAIVSPVVKGWNDVAAKSGRVTLAINLDDIREANEAEIAARGGKKGE